MKHYVRSLDKFIINFAKRIFRYYPNSYSNQEDYIQVGHLTLARINNGNNDSNKKRDLIAYTITAIARAMRELALESMGSVSAPQRIKKLAHQVELLLVNSKTEQEICNELRINPTTLIDIKSLINFKSFDQLFDEPTYNPEPFSYVEDLLSSRCLREEDKIFLRAKIEDSMDDLELTRKQRWVQSKRLCHKVIRSGYGI